MTAEGKYKVCAPLGRSRLRDRLTVFGPVFKRLTVTAFALAGYAGPALSCDGTVLLACDIAGRNARLETCLTGDQVTYRFGPPDAPELTLTQSVRDVGHRPWPGIGRSVWHDVSFVVGDIRYAVHLSIDKLSEPPGEVSGGVTVTRKDETLADLTCKPGSIIGAGDPSPVFEAKRAAGQEFDRQTGQWRDLR